MMPDSKVSAKSSSRRNRRFTKQRFGAAWRGRRDGRRSLPMIPGSPADEGLPLPDSDYQRSLQVRTDEIALQQRAALLESSDRIIAAVFGRATDVCRHHDAGDLTKAQQGRLRASLVAWTVRFEARQSRVEAAVAQANQQLAWYWHGVRRSHPVLRAVADRYKPPGRFSREARLNPLPQADLLVAWRPRPVELDPVWTDGLSLLEQIHVTSAHPEAASFGDLVRALKIIAAPA